MSRLGPLVLAGCLSMAPAALAAGREKPAAGRLKGFPSSQEQPVTAELIAEHTSIQPGDQTRVGVRFAIQEGWHSYAEDPGDAGLPTKITWTIPPGFKAGLLQWPPTQKFIDAGNIRTFGYSGAVVLVSTLKYVASRESLTEAPIRAHVEWLACKEICIPGSAELNLSLPVSSQPPVRSANAELFN